jgi:hypothetical protein
MTRPPPSGSDAFQDALRAYSATFPEAGLPFLLIDIDGRTRPRTVAVLRAAIIEGRPLERGAILRQLGFHPPSA